MKEGFEEIVHRIGHLRQDRESAITASFHPESTLRALTDVTQIVNGEAHASNNKSARVPVEARVLTLIDGHLVGGKAYNSFVLAGISPRWSPHAPYSPDVIAHQMDLDPLQQQGLLLTYGFSPNNLKDLEEGGYLPDIFAKFVSMEAERYKTFREHLDPKRFSAIIKDVLGKH